MMSNQITINQPDFIEERNRKYLLIWREIPHWMIVDEDVFQLIKHGNIYDETKHNDVSKTFSEFKRIGILSTSKSKGIHPIKPMIENVTINVTRRCNLRCKHCFLTSNDVKETITAPDIERFLNKGNKYISPKASIAILGGEPLLVKDKVLDIARLAQRWGKEAIVSTNGLLVDSQFAQEARKNNLVVQVSLDGASPSVNDELRGNGSYEKTKGGVEILIENKAYTILSMVVHERNVNDVEAFYRLSRAWGVDEVRFIPLNIMGRARQNGLRPLSSLTLINLLRRIKSEYPEAKEMMKRDYFTILKTICSRSIKRPYCGTGLKTLLIDADGEIYPCPNHQFKEFRCGNINKQSFQEIWLKSPILKMIRKAYLIDENNQECAKCLVKHWCMGGCRGETYDNTKNMHSKSLKCEDSKSAIIEMMWLIGSESPIVDDAQKEEFY